jgi:quercetin dioxygenase-like cupin family protein
MSGYNPFTTDVAPAESTRKVRRLVTGVDDAGKSVFLVDEVCPGKVGQGVPTYVATDLWRTFESPVENGCPFIDPAAQEAKSVGPTTNGTIFRILELPPDKDWRFDTDGAEIKPLAFHTTESIDYAIVLSGEIWAVLDTEERLMKTGDVLVQRGTAHAWSNRSDEPAILAFILIGGTLPSN